VNLQWLASTDGGSTYDTSSIYTYINNGKDQTNATGGVCATNQSSALLSDSTAIGNGTGESYVGRYTLYNPGGALYKQLVGEYTCMQSATLRNYVNGSVYKSTTAVNAFRFLMSSGNITSGTIRVYGVAK
jgi:hypothetical protein